jgi:hypothetical protein
MRLGTTTSMLRFAQPGAAPLVVIGFAVGGTPVVKANYLLLKNIVASGLQVSDYRIGAPEQVEKFFAEIVSLHE